MNFPRVVLGLLFTFVGMSCGSPAAGSDDGGRDAGPLADAGPGAGNDAGPDAGPMPSDGGPDAGPLSDGGSLPRLAVARTTAIPACTVYVDGAVTGTPAGTVSNPYRTIAAAIAAASNGAVICVAQGTYAETLMPGEKYFTLAGGFQSMKAFAVRDSSLYVSKGKGNGTGSFISIVDPGPTMNQLTAIDGFELTGYSQAIFRDVYYSQRFDLTNNFIHDNTCSAATMIGGGFSLNNVNGAIRGNVFAKNKCSRGGAGALGDSTNLNTVTIENNLIDGNAGTEPGDSHGGGLYLFSQALVITGNTFINNTVTGWGAGLYVGAYTSGGQTTKATLSWNVYRDNRAGNMGGGFFCDDSANCASDHEVYEKNCGGNIFLDCGPDGSDPTIATFDHLTNTYALNETCSAAGPGVIINKANTASDAYSFKNAIFWGNATGQDFNASCSAGCANVSVAVTYSDVQTTYANGGITVSFGAGNVASVDPKFVNAPQHDFHLSSTKGHWTPTGFVNDSVDSPVLGAGAGGSELGAYGNSAEASKR